MRRAFFSNSGDLRLALVFRTEADTVDPRTDELSNDAKYKAQRINGTVYEV